MLHLLKIAVVLDPRRPWGELFGALRWHHDLHAVACSAAWQKSGWKNFDPSSKPYGADEQGAPAL
jgi:hypothetical protein